MARKITQKQLKHDEFVDAAFDFGHWLEENFSIVLKWIGAGVIVAVGIVGWQAYAARSLNQARELVAQGAVIYDTAEASGYADASALSEALATFREVGGSSSAPARLARFYEGAALYRLGRLDEAVEALGAVGTEGGDTLVGTTQLLLAQVHVAAGRTDDAMALLEGLASQSDPAIPADRALLELARLQLGTGRTGQAQLSLERILTEFPLSGSVVEARELLQ